MDRILSLPVLDETSPPPDLTPYVRRPGGTWTLRPIQNRALSMALHMRRAYGKAGLLAPIKVGGGKSLIALLLATVLDCDATLILTIPTAIDTMLAQRREVEPHFVLKPSRVVSYDLVSRRPDLLQQWAARFGDRLVIVADEAHKLRNLDTARTRRVGRFLLSNKGVPFVALTGTPTKQSLRDFAHLGDWSLGEGSPLPRPNYESELSSWSSCVDVTGRPGPYEWADIYPLFQWADIEDPGEWGGEERSTAARRAFNLRFRTAPGVVTSRSREGYQGALRIVGREIPIPDEVSKAIAHTLETDTKPNGDAIEDDADAWRIARQLASGYYLLWHWNGPPDFEWLDARRAYHRAVRWELKEAAAPGYDSALLVTNNVAADVDAGRGTRRIHRMWREWLPHREKRWHGNPTPPTYPVWVSAYLVADAIQWAGEQKEPVILWYGSPWLGAALNAAGVPTFGSGFRRDLPEYPSTTWETGYTIAASWQSYGTAKNLQWCRRSLVLDPPSSGEIWEQLIGRTHRDGQRASEVVWVVYQHAPAFVEALKKATKEASYIRETTGYEQKLTSAIMEV